MGNLDTIMDDMRSMGMDDNMINTLVDSPNFDSELYWTQKNVLEGGDIDSLPQDGPSYHKENFGPDGRIMKKTGEYLGEAGKVAAVLIPGAIIAGMAAKLATQDGMAFTQSHNAPAFNHDLNPDMYTGSAPLLLVPPNAPMSPDADPDFDSAYVKLEKPAVGGGTEVRIDTIGIHPYYMNIIVAGGPHDPYHGSWIFTPLDPDASTHAHWYNGSGDPFKGFHSLPEDVKVGLLGPDYALLFDNAGAPDDDEEVTAILNKNWAGNDDNPLPVELIPGSLNVSYDNGVTLDWKTATEVSNYGFEIFRSKYDSNGDLISPEEDIGFVEGHGNSNSPHNYTFKDDDLNMVIGNLRRYRIKQVDNDGTSEWFPNLDFLVSEDAIGPTSFDLGNAYPNPFNPATNVDYRVDIEGPVQIQVYNSLGQLQSTLVDEVKNPGKYTIQFDGSGLPSGTYFVRMEAPGFREVNKIQLVK